MVAQSTRRAVLGAIAASPIIAATVLDEAAASGLPNERTEPMATQLAFSNETYNWNRAFAEYEQAWAAVEADSAVFNALHASLEAEEAAIPHITLPHNWAAGAMERSTANRFSVAQARRDLRARYDPELIPDCNEYQAACRELVDAADARQAEIQSIRDRLGYDVAAERNDALGNRACNAEWALMDTPAPDRAALLWKLEKLLEVDEPDGSTDSWSASAVAQTMADARRLLAA